LGALVRVALDYGTIWHLVSFSIFGASLVLLYSFSSLYHLLPLSEEGILRMRKLDHIMIFVLIAGSYTPFCLVPLHGPWGWTLFGIVWGSALIGLVIKLFWMHAPRWLSTFIYLLMGWSCVIAIYPLIKTVPTGGMFWLIFGGLIYTVGAVIYAMKWPNFGFKHFGFHELWHLFVMGGSASHFIAVYHYVTYL
jgi:hemolysin III